MPESTAIHRDHFELEHRSRLTGWVPQISRLEAALATTKPIKQKLILFFYLIRAANEQTDRLIVSDYRRPWTFAIPRDHKCVAALLRGLGPPVPSLTRQNTTEALFYAIFSVKPWYHSGRSGPFVPKHGSPTVNYLFLLIEFETKYSLTLRISVSSRSINEISSISTEN